VCHGVFSSIFPQTLHVFGSPSSVGRDASAPRDDGENGALAPSVIASDVKQSRAAALAMDRVGTERLAMT
jgi:hypothetical protein